MEKKKFRWKDDEGKIIWKNFGMDLVSALYMIAIILMILAYVHDTRECRNMMENIVEVCEPICEQQKTTPTFDDETLDFFVEDNVETI